MARVEDSAANTPLALLDSPLAFPLTWWLYLVCLIGVDSALVLFLRRAAFGPVVSTANRRARFGPQLGASHWLWPRHVTARERAPGKYAKTFLLPEKDLESKNWFQILLEVLAVFCFPSFASSSLLVWGIKGANCMLGQAHHCPLLAECYGVYEWLILVFMELNIQFKDTKNLLKKTCTRGFVYVTVHPSIHPNRCTSYSFDYLKLISATKDSGQFVII